MAGAARATIRDVASRAGCSITTVSLVLNGKKANIPPPTRQRVWQAARELNYRPNQLAVGMVTKKTGVLGLITPDNNNLFFASLAKEVEKTAREAGYALILSNTGNDPQRDYSTLNMFLDRQVDGIIYVKSTVEKDKNDPCLELVRRQETPVVLLNRAEPESGVPSVMLDHVRGGYLATRYLLDIGHTRIACLTGQMNVYSVIERLTGYSQALAEDGIAYDDALIFEGDFHLGNEQQALDQFFALGATAIFCFNDIMAMGLYREVRRRGLSIPQDISIVGYDDLPFSDLIHPAMTTVSQPVDDIGPTAARVIIDMVNGKQPHKMNHVFAPQLIVRDSTAPLAPGKAPPTAAKNSPGT